MNLLIDSTGIKAEGKGGWNARGYGGAKRRIWRENDEKTREVRGIEVASRNVCDAPMLHELLTQFLSNQDIGSVSADSAFDNSQGLIAQSFDPMLIEMVSSATVFPGIGLFMVLQLAALALLLRRDVIGAISGWSDQPRPTGDDT